jgi:dihydroorotate dehydrogenase
VVQRLAEQLQGRLAIIAAGGIMSGADAASRIASGASLVQLYTGLVYAGPRLVAEVAATLASQPAPHTKALLQRQMQAVRQYANNSLVLRSAPGRCYTFVFVATRAVSGRLSD